MYRRNWTSWSDGGWNLQGARVSSQSKQTLTIQWTNHTGKGHWNPVPGAGISAENSGQIWSEVKQKLSFCSFRQEYSVVHFDRWDRPRPIYLWFTILSMSNRFVSVLLLSSFHLKVGFEKRIKNGKSHSCWFPGLTRKCRSLCLR